MARVMAGVRELMATVGDAVRYGDWRGHLAAWYQVVTGAVQVGD